MSRDFSEIKKSPERRTSGEPSKSRTKSGKPAPSIPRTVLQEPWLFHQKTVKGGHQLVQFLLGTVHGDLQWFPAVQSKQPHKGCGVDLEPVASHTEFHRLFGRQRDKILNIPQ